MSGLRLAQMGVMQALRSQASSIGLQQQLGRAGTALRYLAAEAEGGAPKPVSAAAAASSAAPAATAAAETKQAKESLGVRGLPAHPPPQHVPAAGGGSDRGSNLPIT